MTRTRLLLGSLGLALAACGDNLRALPDASPTLDAPDAPGAPPAPPRAVVVAGDFKEGDPGVLATLDPAARTVTPNAGPAGAIGNDPVLRHIGKELLIVNRNTGNNVTILDDQTLAFKEQLGTGAGSNPQDVAPLGTKLYVATFGGNGLVVLTRGSTMVAPLALPADDPDGEPNCNSVYLVGTSLYVSCELLDDAFSPRGPGKVYVVDTATDTVNPALTVTLGHKNPLGLFERIPAGAPHGGDLVIPTVLFDFGQPDDGTGCVERVTPGAAPSSAGCLVDNADLGGYASRVDFVVDSGVAIGFFAVPTTFPKANLRAFDLPTAAMWADPLNPTAEIITDLAVCPSGQLVVADTAMNANGLRIYNGATELTSAALPIGMPPQSSHGLVCY